ncbi:MAG: energy coupling factor transporter S component ThiW [Thermodesulfobacteriota bacterium]|nr:energy coupling factor transporter S component ThiW [Thermodesulfobacteriota bacterium]
MEKMTEVRKLVLTALLAALAVLLSGIHFPVGPTKVFPFQHMVNALAGVIIGPWYGALSALIAGIIRNAIGTGTVFAFPGGIPGVIVVGLMYRWVRKDWVALTEPLGTGVIGVLLVVLILSPLMGKEFAFAFFFTAFMASSVPGSIIGYLLLKTLRKTKFLELPRIPKS